MQILEKTGKGHLRRVREGGGQRGQDDRRVRGAAGRGGQEPEGKAKAEAEGPQRAAQEAEEEDPVAVTLPPPTSVFLDDLHETESPIVEV